MIDPMNSDRATMADTHQFLAALSSGYPDEERLCIELRPILPEHTRLEIGPEAARRNEWKARRFFSLESRLLEEAIEHAARCTEAFDVYCGVLPRLKVAVGQKQTGRAEDISLARWLWCDVDGGSGGAEGASDLVLDSVHAGKLPAPNLIVCSGGGLHVYYRLTDLVTMLDMEARRAFKGLLHRLVLTIGGTSPAPHADSSRADVASILRIPGTFNRKRPEEPRAVRLIHHDESETYSYAEWQALLPEPKQPHRRKHPFQQTSVKAYTGLLGWSAKGYPQGKRHKDLAGAAAWLLRDLRIEVDIARELLTRKVRNSPGMRDITDREIEEVISWATR